MLHRAADEALEHEFERQGQAQLVEHCGEHTVADQLAIHQDAVTIENHQLGLPHRPDATDFPAAPWRELQPRLRVLTLSSLCKPAYHARES
jgi:hypothetical protein